MMWLFNEYYYALTHWNKKLKRSPKKNKFLATKVLEITSILLRRGKLETEKLAEDIVPEFLNLSNEIETKTPYVAIVVPVYVRNAGGAEKLNNLVESLSGQSYKNVTTIFVDDCSPFSYEVRDDIIHLKLSQNKGPAAARNFGIEKALELNAEIVAFTDSDCIPDKDWIANIVSSFTTDKLLNALSGKTVSHNKCWLGEYQDINGTLNGRRFKYSDYLLYGATCNFAVTRNLLKKIRFDTTFPSAAGEDLEFSFRILKAGFNIAFIENMVIYHDYGYTGNLKKDIPIFWRQFSRHGEGDRILHRVIPYYMEYLIVSEEIGFIEADRDRV